MMRDSSGTILGVQYLRGAACIAVVLFHIFGGSEGSFYVGQAGVDIFFLISGFIMWTVTCRREQSPRQFLFRRLIRVVPLYWGITLLVFARRYLAGKATFPDLAYSLLFVPHRMSDGTVNPIIVPGWTLNFEMFFYIVFALCLFVSVQKRLSVATLILSALVALGFLVDDSFTAVSVYTNPLLLEFLLGAWIGYAHSRVGLPGPRAGVVALALGVAALLVQQIEGIGSVEWRVVLFGLPSAAILFGMIALEQLTPEVKSLKGLGDASYAIYLVHVPIMSLLIKIDMPLLVRMLVVLGLSVAVGTVFHIADLSLNKKLRGRPKVAKPAFPASSPSA